MFLASGTTSSVNRSANRPSRSSWRRRISQRSRTRGTYRRSPSKSRDTGDDVSDTGRIPASLEFDNVAECDSTDSGPYDDGVFVGKFFSADGCGTGNAQYSSPPHNKLEPTTT